MDIVFLSTEAVPFAKTGGLGDVCGALPATLAERGHHVTLLLPAFSSIHNAKVPIRRTNISFAVEIRDRIVGARLLAADLPGVDTTRPGVGQASVYFIDQPQYYARPALYGDGGGDYSDNCERFAFFCRAALHAISRLNQSVDIVHCNDWQTGLVPAYMATGFESHAWMKRAKSVFTIHNLAYQGQFWHWDFPLTGLDWQWFTPTGIEFYGGINFLKAGIQFADRLTTVSPTYAHEIQTPEFGCGLDPLLRSRSGLLSGITNGIDDTVWNPASNPHLRIGDFSHGEIGPPPSRLGGRVEPQQGEGSATLPPGNYDITNWQSGKAAQKGRLQEQLGLKIDPQLPLVGVVSRLAGQKGWDLILELVQLYLHENRPVQWAILGTGERQYEEALAELAGEYPDHFGLQLAFSDSLAHRIEAAADLFLMPSRYEPCGLNQLYSLRYGTVPIVSATGGLVDTVTPVTAATIADGTATGFQLQNDSLEHVDQVLGEALRIRYHEPKVWETIVRTGMSQDWSWRQSAAQYEQLYDSLSSVKLREPKKAGKPRR